MSRLLLLLGICGCGGGLSRFDLGGEAGPAGPLTVDRLVPERGPATGGEDLTLLGTGFVGELSVDLGASACVTVTVISSAEMLCTIPPGTPGEAVVTVTRDDGRQARSTFTYETDGSDGSDGSGGSDGSDGSDGSGEVEPVDYCHVQWPCSLQTAAGTETEPLYVWVYKAGVTEGDGPGPGIRVEVGHGPVGSVPDASWIWQEAVYNTDTDGLASGDRANDEHRGWLSPATAGRFHYAARASADGGTRWVVCDLGGDSCGGSGSDDGYGEPGLLTVD